MGYKIAWMFFEELGQLPADLLYKVAIPMMALRRVSAIGISSKPTSEDSPMNRLINARLPRSNKFVFKTRVFSPICAKCQLRQSTNCSHKVEMAWSDSKQAAKIEGLMADQRDNYRREILNEDVASDITAVFASDLIEGLRESQYVLDSNYRFRYVFVGIDPAAGGDESQFAIVSLVSVPPSPNSTDELSSDSNIVVRPPLPFFFIQYLGVIYNPPLFLSLSLSLSLLVSFFTSVLYYCLLGGGEGEIYMCCISLSSDGGGMSSVKAINPYGSYGRPGLITNGNCGRSQ
jgi:hypothetical protein